MVANSKGNGCASRGLLNGSMLLAMAVFAQIAGCVHATWAASEAPALALPPAAFTESHELNLRAFGARLDGRSLTDLSVTRGSAVIISDSAHFSSADAGKLIIICFSRPGTRQPLNTYINTYTGRIVSVQAPTRATLATPYPGETNNGGFAFFATDDTAALQAAIDGTGGVERSRTGVIKLPGRPAMISRTLLFENKSIEFAGQGMLGTIVGNNPGTALVWAGPSGMPMIKVLKCYGMRIHDLNLMGNSNPANRPSALIELANPPEIKHHPNSFNRFYNLHGGTSSSANDPDIGVQAASGILLVDQVNNDRNMFENVRLDGVGVGYDNRNRQAVVEYLSNFTCRDCSIAINMANGGDLDVVNLEVLVSGRIFAIGHAARITVDVLDNENRADQMGLSQLVRYETGGGALTVRHGNFSISCSIPPSGVIVDTSDNAAASLVLSEFWFTRNASCPATVAPVIRFKGNNAGVTQRYFICDGCRGLASIRLDLGATGRDSRDVSMIAIREKPERPGDVGSDSFNLLQGPDGRFDLFRRDVPGKLNVMGGPMTVRQLAPPSMIYGGSCVGGSGSKPYYYRVTARAGGTETSGSPERAIRCGGGLSDSEAVTLYWMPSAGADSYGIYRGEAPGQGRLIAVVPANTFPANTYSDKIPRGALAGYRDAGGGPIGGSVPATNTTGTTTLDGELRLGSRTFAALGAAPDGTQLYCRDCRGASEGAPCQRGGAGQLAVRVARIWKCF